MHYHVVNQEHLTAFKDYLYLEEKSAATVEKYSRDAGAFVAFISGRELTKELTVEYKHHLKEQGYAVRSINSMLAGVNRFLTFMGRTECQVKGFRVQKQSYCNEDKELSKKEYMRLLNACEQDKRLYLLLQTICGTGIRVSELQYFTVEAVKEGKITVHCKSKCRIIFVPKKLKKMLLTYAKKNAITKGRIFVTRTGKPLDRSNIWQSMKKLCARAGVNSKKVFPHNLRKLFARTFYGMEKDIAKLADILGHSSIETTRIYIMSSGQEHREKMERLGLVVQRC